MVLSLLEDLVTSQALSPLLILGLDPARLSNWVAE